MGSMCEISRSMEREMSWNHVPYFEPFHVIPREHFTTRRNWFHVKSRISRPDENWFHVKSRISRPDENWFHVKSREMGQWECFSDVIYLIAHVKLYLYALAKFHRIECLRKRLSCRVGNKLHASDQFLFRSGCNFFRKRRPPPAASQTTRTDLGSEDELHNMA